MRGVKSYAMLLCASSKDGKEGGVEFVLPPAGSQPGERIYFEGEKYESKLPRPTTMTKADIAAAQPETQLNPKKKVFETIQPVSLP
jgi:aminoacyl tRNA synthase complex-interacting multifunctional protein 1